MGMVVRVLMGMVEGVLMGMVEGVLMGMVVGVPMGMVVRMLMSMVVGEAQEMSQEMLLVGKGVHPAIIGISLYINGLNIGFNIQ